MLRINSSESYTPAGFIDTERSDDVVEGRWREDTAPKLCSFERHAVSKNIFSRLRCKAES